MASMAAPAAMAPPASGAGTKQEAAPLKQKQSAASGSSGSSSCNPAVIAAIVAVVCAIIAVVTGCLHQNIACYTMSGLAGASAILALCCRNKTSEPSTQPGAPGTQTGKKSRSSSQDSNEDL
jgi:hypothetical protein